MRIFVTGGGGFVGSAFLRAAIERGYSLLCLSRSGSIPSADGVQVTKGALDSVDWKDLERFAPEACLHLAWTAKPGEYLDSPENATLMHQSARLFEDLAKRGVEHIAGVGTCIEYAPSDEPVSESGSPTAPEFPYSIAKLDLHDWLAAGRLPASTTWSWLRIFHPYGPGEHPGRLASTFARNLAAGDDVVLKTPGSVKDFIFVDDLARALCDVVATRLTGAVNLGTGVGHSIRSLAEHVADAVGAPRERVRDSDVVGHDPRPFLVADTRRLRSTGWRPRVALEQGVERVVGALGLSAA